MYDDNPNNEPSAPKNSADLQRKWLKNIETAEKYFRDWFEKSDKIIKLYRKTSATTSSKRAFAMLWANTEVMKPVVYSQTPQPAVGRRFKDRDPAGKTASEILERAAAYQFDLNGVDRTIKNARDDMLLPGRGVVWVRFVKDGTLAFDYVNWRDFLHSPARNWPEVTWVAKRTWFGKEQIKKRFGIEGAKLAKLSPDSVPRSSGMTDDERKALEGKYAIWEIWDRTQEKVIFLTPSSDETLEIIDPYLTLTDFWPMPEPIYATMTTDSMVPVPDYQYYQDQAEEIDDLTRRISSLTDSLKVVGFYPRGQEDSAAIEKALEPGVENRMIGVESWAAFAEKGGGKAIIFLPIDMVVAVIQACVELRQQLIQDVYQITGISDIMRGATDPNETLGAQQLKAQTGSVRVRGRQQEVQRFARDITKISCEVMAEKFSPQTLMVMTNYNTQENATPEKVQEIEAAMQLLQNDQLRDFRIDVETDSTIQPDEQADKEARVEFLTAVGGFIQQAMPVAQAMPALLPMIGEFMRFMVRGFRAGSQLEDVIDKTVDQMQQQAEQAAQQPPQPPPEQQKAEADIEAKKAVSAVDLQHTEAKNKLELQQMQQKHDAEMARGAAAHQQTLQQGEQANNAKLRAGRNEAILSLAAKGNGKIPPEMAEGAEPPPDPISEIATAVTAAMQQVAQIIDQGNQQLAQLLMQSNQQMAQLITAPKSITTPDGRTYTAQPQIVGGEQNGASNPNF